jgi:hypothetical protein
MGANEKLLSRRFKMESSAGWLEEPLFGKGMIRLVENTLAERLV